MNNKKIVLTDEQKKCVDSKSEDLLVKGVAGSGKSQVILHRAKKQYEKKLGYEKVIILTYANTLVEYTNELIMNGLGEDAIQVKTVDSFFLDVYYQTFHHHFTNKDNFYETNIKNALAKHQRMTGMRSRFYSIDLDFFKEEFNWIRERLIDTQTDYLNAERKGRSGAIRLSQVDKKMVWSIFEVFREIAKAKGYQDFQELYVILNREKYLIPESAKVHYILVDEAQDMTLAKMAMIKFMTKKQLTVAADTAQKIYKTSFTWKEAGIDFSGRSSKSLTKSFRSTKQIVELAEDLMDKNRMLKDVSDEYTDAVLPEVEGDLPVVAMFSSASEEEAYLLHLIKSYLEDDCTIGIICRTEYEIKKMLDWLQRNNISPQWIKKVKKDEPKWSLLKSGVKIVKAHSSKGLEFDRVIIPHVNDENNYPYRISKVDKDATDDFLATERSLLYVAMTRARVSLAMTCNRKYHSRFIDEFKTNHYYLTSL